MPITSSDYSAAARHGLMYWDGVVSGAPDAIDAVGEVTYQFLLKNYNDDVKNAAIAFYQSHARVGTAVLVPLAGDAIYREGPDWLKKNPAIWPLFDRTYQEIAKIINDASITQAAKLEALANWARWNALWAETNYQALRYTGLPWLGQTLFGLAHNVASSPFAWTVLVAAIAISGAYIAVVVSVKKTK